MPNKPRRPYHAPTARAPRSVLSAIEVPSRAALARGPEQAGPLCALGIDASLTRTAFCIIWAARYDHDEWRFEQAHEVIITTASWTLTRRLRALANAAYRIAMEHRPDVVMVEEPGFVVSGHGLGPITTLGRAQGAIIAGLPPDIENVHPIMVQRLRSNLALKVPRGKGMAKAATLAYVEARGITVPRTKTGHDDDVADGFALCLEGLRLQGVPLGGTLPGALDLGG